MEAHVLIPLKRLDTAKSRLAVVLTSAERAALMRALFRNVLDVTCAARVGPVTVVTGEKLEGVRVWDDRGLPWNDALAAAMREAVTEDVVAVIAADLPCLCPDDVRALVNATPHGGIAVGRATDGGTNALSMRPPALVRTHFGSNGSAAVHAALGVPTVILDRPGLAFDVDTPSDLERVRRDET